MGPSRGIDNSLSYEKLISELRYYPESGRFIRLKGRHRGKPVGVLTKHGYIRVRIGNHRIMAHRLAFLYMTGEFPRDIVDHINRIRNDNRWENLRLADSSENVMNSTTRKDNTSGVKGVNLNRSTGKWVVRIQNKDGRKYLGSFDSFQEACTVVKIEREKLHGIFCFEG